MFVVPSRHGNPLRQSWLSRTGSVIVLLSVGASASNWTLAVPKLPPEAASWRKPNVAPGAKFDEMKQRAAQIAKSTPSNEKLKTAQTLLSAVPSCLLPEDQPEQKEAQAKIKRAAEEQQKAETGKK